jgi:hypothetical protein
MTSEEAMLKELRALRKHLDQRFDGLEQRLDRIEAGIRYIGECVTAPDEQRELDGVLVGHA